MVTLKTFLTLNDDDALEAVFDIWLDSPDGRRWDRSDFRCSEDDQNARFHFEQVFENTVVDLPDPGDEHCEGLAPEVWDRLDALATDFFELVYDHINGAS